MSDDYFGASPHAEFMKAYNAEQNRISRELVYSLLAEGDHGATGSPANDQQRDVLYSPGYLDLLRSYEAAMTEIRLVSEIYPQALSCSRREAKWPGKL